MSLYQHMPVPGAGQEDDAALSNLLDAGGGIINGLNMDISLPMDLELDLGSDAQNYGSLAQQEHATAASRLQNNGMMTGSGGEGALSSATNSSAGQDPRQQQQQQQQLEATLTGAGAGPLPTGFGMSVAGNGSTLTEFTKRRNWSQRIIEELKDFLHILTPDGRILYVSPSCKNITGYEPSALVGKFIAEYVHPDDSGIFMREFNESIASGNRLRFFYRFKKEDGSFTIFECDGHPHISHDTPVVAQNTDSSVTINGTCRGFFMMARPYPTKNAALLDSFLEHKIENERLLKRRDELKREEVEDNTEQERIYREHVASTTGGPTSDSGPGARNINDSSSDTGAAVGATTNFQGMPPPAKPPVSNTALTRQNLDSALSAQKPDSIADKMSRYEANSTHLESIELLTGLRYRDGERSHGISTGDTSPALIRGDAGIAILVDRDRDGLRKDKKKPRLADEYVCADCGTLDSPEWRKGPKGPKTLCNACGLRWAKKEKKIKTPGVDDKNESPQALTAGSIGMAAGGGSVSAHPSTMSNGEQGP